MKHLTKAILIIVALGLTACTNPGQMGGGAGGNGSGAGGANGEANNPRSVTYFQQTIGDRVLFTVDTSTLTPEGRETLMGQSKWLIDNPEFAAIVEGHADEQGTREYNLALGARRSNAVAEFLISQGIAATRIRTLTYGKERPIEICSAEACYSKNRRAVTVISAGAGA